MDKKSKIILIAGPTASGKSKFALIIAKKNNGEIINADSMQVYKQFKILTARPSKADQKKIKHHLYGFVDVRKTFSVGQWLKLVTKKIKEIQKRGKVPIVVGGTGLYFQSLLQGLVKIPKIPLKIRNYSRKLQIKLGQEKFYKRLLKLDKKIKNKFDPNDTQRTIRAYEIKKYTKKSMYDWFKETKPIFLNNTYQKFFINLDKGLLLNKIEKRINKMIKNGAVSEVKKILKLKIPSKNSSYKVIGFLELKDYLKKEISLNKAKELMAIKTRQYAKRQITWSNSRMQDWKTLNL